MVRAVVEKAARSGKRMAVALVPIVRSILTN
jgi:hypothetical protein